MAIGEKLKRARLNKNYTQDFMAEMLRVSQKTYSNFENDKTVPDFNQLEQLAKILEISVLVFLTDEKFSSYQTNSADNNNAAASNHLSDKLIEQYELRIKKMEEENNYLKLLLNKLANQ